MLPASQLDTGDLTEATRRLRTRGWVAISNQLAQHLDVGLGETIQVPTPTGDARFRVAAVTTNLGWTPGAIMVNTADYRHRWGTGLPSAIEVAVDDRANMAAVRASLEQRLGNGVRVQLASERASGINASARQGLTRLSQISLLLVLGAALALGAAISAAIWQRRSSLALARLLGSTRVQVWRTLLIETAVVIASGCLTGVMLGLVGQVAIDSYLIEVTGFPVETVLLGTGTLAAFAAVVATALLVAAGPGWKAAAVSPTIALRAD